MKELIVRICNSFVVNKECEYMEDLSEDYDKFVDFRPTEASDIMDEIFRESERTDPYDKWDEEEVLVAKVVSRK